MPFLSVIIPLYNKGFIISETLQSVLAQTFTDFEVVVINDGSTDNGFEIVSQFLDERIKCFQQKNKGVAAARNLGIAKAKGEFIAFLDADDYWYPNHLEELVKLINDFPNCGMYCSRYQTMIAKNHIINNSFSYSFADDYRGIVSDFFQASLVNRIATSSSIIVPKNIILEFNGFNIAISNGEDLELWIKIAIKNNVAINNVISAIYHFEAQNSLAKLKFTKKALIDLNQFSEEEKENKSLKKFLDIYRLEYALQYRIAGDIENSKKILKNITSNIPTKTKILLSTPIFVLRLLLKTKHLLKKFGVDFTVYH